ncbi:MAG: peptidoglycan-binding protein [Deltaproteobacteria bacterium]|nr:peptidoglycan-binding protein [Deltaproteobacteria bacterium]
MVAPSFKRPIWFVSGNTLPDEKELQFIADAGFTDVVLDLQPHGDRIFEDEFFISQLERISQLADGLVLTTHGMVGLRNSMAAMQGLGNPDWLVELAGVAEALDFASVIVSFPEFAVSSNGILESVRRLKGREQIVRLGVAGESLNSPEIRAGFSVSDFALLNLSRGFDISQVERELLGSGGKMVIPLFDPKEEELDLIQRVLDKIEEFKISVPRPIAFSNFDSIRRVPQLPEFIARIQAVPANSDMPSTGVMSSTGDGLPDLKVGNRGTGVGELQVQLKKQGYALEVDSQFGPATAAAVTAFQRDHDLPATGVADFQTRAAIAKEPSAKTPTPSIEESPPADAPIQPGRARITGDTRTDEDSLRIGVAVDCFARLFAAKDVRPPVSLGLFGNWGAGKTYFMSQLKKRITELSDERRETYVNRVAHIEFNAWHYSDANLWANLAVRIFDGLSNELKEETTNGETDAFAQARARLRQRLHSSREAIENAKTLKATVEQQQQSLKQTLHLKQAERKDAVEMRQQLAWGRYLTRALEDDQFVKQISESLSTRDPKNTIDDLKNAKAHIDNLKIAKARIEKLNSLRQQYDSSLMTYLLKHYKVLLVSVFLGVVLLGVPLALGAIDAVSDTVRNWLSAIIAPLGGLATALIKRKQMISNMGGAISRLRKIMAEVDASSDDDTASPDEKNLLVDIAHQDRIIDETNQALVAASTEILKTEKEIIRLESGGLVYDFLAERQDSDSYRSQLGVISTIRRDFRQLAELLNGWNEEQAPNVNPDRTVTDGVLDPPDGDGGPALKSTSPVDRIILYIDDLDRCHPDRVVEVLQAVHLLLALDLFMVVVAVDARWLERSLYKTYLPEAISRPSVSLKCVSENAIVNGMRIDGTVDIASDKKAASFSPQNYLEKIFQIPYSLPKMDADGFGRLVDALTRGGEDVAVSAVPLPIEEPTPLSGGIEEGEESKVVAPARDVPSPSTPVQKGETPEPGADEAAVANAAQPDLAPGDAPGSKAISPLQVDDTAISVSEMERNYMRLLHGFVDTPRLAKRMVNIYRILRVGIAQQMAESDFSNSSIHQLGFLSNEVQGYRAAMVLLAINVGFPRVGGPLTRWLEEEEPAKSFLSLIQTLDAIGPIKTGKRRPYWIAEQLNDSNLRPQIARIAENVSALAEQKEGIVNDIEPYRILAPFVGQYSFRWHLDT